MIERDSELHINFLLFRSSVIPWSVHILLTATAFLQFIIHMGRHHWQVGATKERSMSSQPSLCQWSCADWQKNWKMPQEHGYG